MTNAELDALAKGLEPEQKVAILRANERDVSERDYMPFFGRSKGLFVIAPGWGCLEMTPLGLALRNHLRAQEGSAGGEG